MGEMISLPEFEGFDWSGGNAEKNWRKHRAAPSEAEQVFLNLPLMVAADAGHSDSEQRYFILGRTDEGRELYVVFTLRGRRVRIISARDMSRQERKVYRSS
jgi:uncharacterized DUF497 family protein